MLSFKNINKINRYERNLVYGYVRRLQKVIKHQIPYIIDCICLLFFYEMDQFGKTKMDQFGYYSKFGAMNIMHTEYSSKFLYQWIFKCSPESVKGLVIGITDSTNPHWFLSHHEHHVAWTRTGLVFKTNYKPSQTDETEHYIRNYRTENRYRNRRNWILPNDEIIISIDIKEKLLEYVISRDGELQYEDMDIPIIFEKKNHKYRIAAYCRTEMNIELTAFKKIVRTSGKNYAYELILRQIERNEERQNWINKYLNKYYPIPGMIQDK